MRHEEHVARAINTVRRAREANSSVLYAARFLARHIQRMRCAWCDVKYQRNQGGYKDDSIIDGIAYDSVLAGVVAELDARTTGS